MAFRFSCDRVLQCYTSCWYFESVLLSKFVLGLGPKKHFGPLETKVKKNPKQQLKVLDVI